MASPYLAERPFFQMLSKTSLAPSLSIETIARRTEGLSGSDLKEVCRNAAMAPVREYMRDKGGDHAEMMKAQKEASPKFEFLLLNVH